MKKSIRRSLKLAKRAITKFEKSEKDNLYLKKIREIEKIEDAEVRIFELSKINYLYEEDKKTYEKAKLFVEEFEKSLA